MAKESKVNPVNDQLEQECNNFMLHLRKNNIEEKSRSFGIIKQLWTIRIRSGDDLPAPDVPAEILRQHGFSTAAQVRWVGAILERLRARRDARYGR